MAYDALSSGDIDADSPADTTLWTKVKDCLDWLRGAFDGTTGHAHTGAANDGPLIASVSDAAIVQVKLKTATGEVSTTSTTQSNFSLPGGSYGFYPQIKMANTSIDYWKATIVPIINVAGFTTFRSNIALAANSSNNLITAQQRYIQASPPYKIGDTEWGHFLFLLRKLGTREVVSTYQAEDPPWAYNGRVWLPKDHVDRISEVPHPFGDYIDKDPATEGLEVVIVNLAGINVAKWRGDNEKIGKSILEDLGSVLTGMGVQRPFSDYNVPAIPRFTDRVKVITP